MFKSIKSPIIIYTFYAHVNEPSARFQSILIEFSLTKTFNRQKKIRKHNKYGTNQTQLNYVVYSTKKKLCLDWRAENERVLQIRMHKQNSEVSIAYKVAK